MIKGEKLKILIIEDDGFLQQMYVSKLAMEGFDVISAYDGVKGLKLAQVKKPDLIILDLKLPEIDGFEVLTKLKKDKETKKIPVIILSNLSQKNDIDRCLNAGAVGYLIKAHFVPSEVISQVKKVLDL